MNIGVFGLDPGGASGVGWGLFNPHHKEGADGAIRERQLHGTTTVEGGPREQIREISSLWLSFYRSMVTVGCLPPDRIWFVSEDYIQVPGNTSGGKETQISSSVMWGIEGYRMGRADEWKEHKRGGVVVPTMILQPAGMAMGAFSNDRLRNIGWWPKGRDHEQSVVKHICYFVKHYVIQHPNG